MKIEKTSYLLVLVVAIVLFFVFKLMASLFDEGSDKRLEEAAAFYAQGEKAATLPEREKAFNQALEIYSQLEEQHHPSLGNGKLYYNIGNSFYQLRAYPWAILGYYKALALSPRDEKMRNNLEQAKLRLNIRDKSQGSWVASPFFQRLKLAVPERIQLISALTLVAFICFSLYNWVGRHLWKIAGAFFSFFVILLFFSLAYSYYLAPVEGVVMESTLLYRDAGFQYAPVSEQPVPSGEIAVLLELSDDGKWLKIKDSSGVVGYLPAEALRLISS